MEYLTSSYDEPEGGRYAQESPTSLVASVHAGLLVMVVVLAGNESMSLAEVVDLPYYCLVVEAGLLENDFDGAAFVDSEDHPESSAYSTHPKYFRPLTLVLHFPALTPHKNVSLFEKILNSILDGIGVLITCPSMPRRATN